MIKKEDQIGPCKMTKLVFFLPTYPDEPNLSYHRDRVRPLYSLCTRPVAQGQEFSLFTKPDSVIFFWSIEKSSRKDVARIS